MARQSPFDPFSSFDDDCNDNEGGQVASKDGARSKSKKSTAMSSTNSRSRQRSLDRVQEEVGPKPLPPRLNVRLTVHEEISSTAVADPGGESGSLSQLSIEGKVTARVESSNANKNAPFSLQISGPMASMASITRTDHCVLEEEEDATKNTPFTREDIGVVRCRVDIPKSEVAGCDILVYSLNVRTQNMPILVQTKAAIHEKTCRISVQVRSNLSNRGDLVDFAIVVAIPPTLRGDTLEITRGDRGVWDANKSIVTWRVGDLPHGESCLVSAEAEVVPAVADLLRDNPFDVGAADDKVRCPVLVRCLSEVDQVSDLRLSALELEGAPATIVQQQSCSYRLLHRVGNEGGVRRAIISAHPPRG